MEFVKSLYIEKFDLFIRYLDLPGNSPVRLVLPGLATTSLVMLDTFLDPLLSRNRTLFFDYPGVLMSETSSRFHHTLEEIVYCIKETMNIAQIKKVEVIGHSMGGTVAAQLAMKYPNLVTKIILCEANIYPGGGPGSSRIASESYEVFVKSMCRYMDQIRELAINGDPTGVFLHSTMHFASFETIYKHAKLLVHLRDDFIKDLFGFAIPVTFIYGEKNLPSNQVRTWPDTPNPEKLERNGINIEVVPNSGHFMMIDNPKGYVNCILRGLEFNNQNSNKERVS